MKTHFKELKRKNIQKTYLVIFIELLLYLIIGLSFDFLTYQDTKNRFIPFFTVIFFSLGIFNILLGLFFFKKILLKGDKYIKIDENNKEYKNLYNIVEELKISARLNYMPEIYILEDNTLNAFASGWKENNSIIVVTKGLYKKLNREELSAVIAHEMSHIINQDIKLSLIISSANAMLINILYFFGYNKNEEGNKANVLIFLLIIFFEVFTYLLFLFLSRTREYLADATAVELTRNPNGLVNALSKINDEYMDNKEKYETSINKNPNRKYFLFFNPYTLFSTHPSVEDRIKEIKKLYN